MYHQAYSVLTRSVRLQKDKSRSSYISLSSTPTMSNKKPEIPTISTPTPFKVEFGEAAISDLRARLQNARFGTEGILPAEEAFSMELHPKLSTLKEWTKEWEHLDFQKFEDDLNRFEHFTTKIDWCSELRIFVRYEERAISLTHFSLLCHQIYTLFISDPQDQMQFP